MRVSPKVLIGLQTAVLLLMFGLAIISMRQKAPTFDEQSYIVRGLAYLRGENQHMRVGHPLGLNALNALLLVGDESVRLPVDHPAWALTSFHRPAELFMWEIGNDVEKIIFLGRLPTIWLGMLMVSIGARWAHQMNGKRLAGVFALVLLALDPNILAHTRLSSTDLGLAFGATLAGFLLWQFFKQPSWLNVVLAAAGFAVLQNTKFTAGLFVPLFAVVILVGLVTLWRREGAFPKRPFIQLLLGFPLPAFLFLWAMYGFQIGTLPDSLPTLPQLSGLTLPLAHHLEQLLDIGGRLQKSTPAFLLGNYSDSGWWYYFPVAFVLKTPLPTLILLGLALILMIRRWRGGKLTPFDTAALLIPAVGYFVIALTTDINLGYRHLLPILPFLAVWIGAEVGAWDSRSVKQNTPIHHSPFTIYHLPFILIFWLFILTLFTFPHYLAFFNLFAGGANNGYKSLVDSNVDWGQDLPLLRVWMDENDVDHVWLSYFGEARPEYYGISYTGLDSFPPRLMNPNQRPFNPTNPAPGIYAISATTLQGVHFANHEQFRYFWDKEPLATLGHSIFLYQVDPFGEPIDLVLDDIQLDELTAVDLNQLNTNQLNLHWTYGPHSRLYTASDVQWVATHWPQTWLASGEWEIVSDQASYTLLRSVEKPHPQAPTLLELDGSIMQLGAVFEGETAVQNQPLIVTTTLLNNSTPQPIRQFVHLINTNGDIVAQDDRFDAAWQQWGNGDWLVQQSTLNLDVPTGTYQLWTGLYDPQTGTRWQLADGSDRVFLGEITIVEQSE